MEFPTMAERAIAEWRVLPKTTPFNTVANRHGAFRGDDGKTIMWIFDDGSRVEITGRGASYKIVAKLP